MSESGLAGAGVCDALSEGFTEGVVLPSHASGHPTQLIERVFDILRSLRPRTFGARDAGGEQPAAVTWSMEERRKGLSAFDEPACDEVGQRGVGLVRAELEGGCDVLDGLVQAFAVGLQLGEGAKHGQGAVRVGGPGSRRGGRVVVSALAVEEPRLLGHVNGLVGSRPPLVLAAHARTLAAPADTALMAEDWAGLWGALGRPSPTVASRRTRPLAQALACGQDDGVDVSVPGKAVTGQSSTDPAVGHHRVTESPTHGRRREALCGHRHADNDAETVRSSSLVEEIPRTPPTSRYDRSGRAPAAPHPYTCSGVPEVYQLACHPAYQCLLILAPERAVGTRLSCR